MQDLHSLNNTLTPSTTYCITTNHTISSRILHNTPSYLHTLSLQPLTWKVECNHPVTHSCQKINSVELQPSGRFECSTMEEHHYLSTGLHLCRRLGLTIKGVGTLRGMERRNAECILLLFCKFENQCSWVREG